MAIIFIEKKEIISYAGDINAQNIRNQVLIDARIIDNIDNLDKQVRRDEFAKMIVKSSIYKNYVPNVNNVLISSDVTYENEYASYIKSAIDNKFMFTYLGGFFKPNEYVSYNDLTRACLSLLGYEDSDFIGNKVISRNLKFEALELNENIDKEDDNNITKLDIINAIYNTLKHKMKDGTTELYEKVFSDMYKAENGELVSIGLTNIKVKGPFIAKKGQGTKEIETPFEYRENDIYINGILSDEKTLNDDLENFGYIVYYYDIDKNVLYAYSCRDDISTTIAVKKGYVNEIRYDASNMITPKDVIIDGQKYIFGNEESKLKFSYSGSIKMDDYVVFIYNKMADVVNDDEKDSGMPVKGRIVNAFIYDTMY